MNKKLKSMVCSALSLLMLFSVSLAGVKEEVVYANLNSDGSVDNIYVVNILTAENGVAQDYGKYSSVRNMTSEDQPVLDGDSITVNTQSEKVYLEGLMSGRDMPWNINIEYYLDGHKYASEEILGKSGELEIKIFVTQNFAIDKKFYDDFVLQTSMTFDTEKFADLTAEGATVSNVGSSKQVSHMALPGKGLSASIKARVNNFEMEEISINAIKLSMDIDTEDIDVSSFTGDLRELGSGTGKLYKGTKDLSDGFGQLAQGISDAAKGASSLSSGLDKLAGSGDAVVSGAQQLADSILVSANAQIKASMPGATTLTWNNYADVLSGMIGVNDDMRVQAKGQLESQTGLTGDNLDTLLYLAAGKLPKSGVTQASIQNAVTEGGNMMQQAQGDSAKIAKAQADLTGAGNNPIGVSNVKTVLNHMVMSSNTSIKDPGVITDEMRQQAYLSILSQITEGKDEEKAVIMVLACNEVVSSNKSLNEAVQHSGQVLTNALQVDKASAAVKTTDGKNSIKAFLTQTVKVNSGSQLNDLSDLLAGLAGTQHFVSQLKDYTGGVSSLAKGAKDLDKGLATIDKASGDIKSGFSELEKGTKALRDATANIDGEAKSKIDDAISSITDSMFGSDDVYSFVSDKNDDVKSLQFSMKTPKLVIEKQEETKQERQENKGFIEKLKELF